MNYIGLVILIALMVLFVYQLSNKTSQFNEAATFEEIAK